jgi:hypothetical protein
MIFMKKLICSLLTAIPLACSGQGARIQPGGVPTPVPIYDTITISNLIRNLTLAINSNTVFTLASNTAYTVATNTVSGATSNSFNLLATNTFSAFDDYFLVRTFSNIITERYALDFSRTNSAGQPINYAHLIYSNFPAAVIFDVTNIAPNRMLSFNVTLKTVPIKSILFPTNTFWPPRFDTNGWAITSASYWGRVLTNGNEFRMTIKTNEAGLSTTWHIYTQP